MTIKELEYHRVWRKNNREKIRQASGRYRAKNLELCRKRTRLNQIKVNDRNRFGGFRQKALERDKYICQGCGADVSEKRAAAIHHINHNRSDNRLENFKTLCHRCHGKHHDAYREKNNRMQYI